MSVVPLPKPEPEPSPAPTAQADAEGWALLEALRRRLDDQGSQGRKTQQEVRQLAESIGALVAEQRRRAKWANLNSFVAYLIFTLLVGAGFYLLYRSRAHELVEARDSAQRERDQAVKRADDLAVKTNAREQADGRAWEVYQLLEAGKRSEAAGKLGALGDLPLSRTERAVLAARAHETQVMEVDAALKAAAGSFKAGRYGDVIAPLEAALVSEPAGARASTMRYFLGVAYAKANNLDKATQLLALAVAADVDQDDARFQLASALDRSGQYAKARTEYDRFATAHPQSTLAVFAMRRSATLARMPAAANVTTPPATGAPSIEAPSPTPKPSAAPNPAPNPNAAAPTSPTTPPANNVPNAAPPVTPKANAAPPPAPRAPAVKSTAPKPTAPPKDLPATDPAPATDQSAPMSSIRGLAPVAIEPLSTTGEPAKEPKRPAPSVEPKPNTRSKPTAPQNDPKPASPPKLGAPPPPVAMPIVEGDRTPAPSPSGPPVEREPAPSPRQPPRHEGTPGPVPVVSDELVSFSTPSEPARKPKRPAPAPSVEQNRPAPPKPAAPPQNEPKPAAPPKLGAPPPPVAMPIVEGDRTPAPSPSGPPVDREPQPSPRQPPRHEGTPGPVPVAAPDQLDVER